MVGERVINCLVNWSNTALDKKKPACRRSKIYKFHKVSDTNSTLIELRGSDNLGCYIANKLHKSDDEITV